MENPTCGTCVYWLDHETASNAGDCRRKSPKHIIIIDEGNSEEMNDFAIVGKNDWCGDHPDFPKWMEEQRSK